MKAIVLVAGYAQRLYPLTKDKPKALLTLGGVTLLDSLMKKVEEVDAVDEVILVSNHKFYDQFNDWKETYNGTLNIKVLDDGTETNETRLGAIGDTQFAIEQCGIDDDIMLLVSDNYFTFSLKDYYDFYKQRKTDCILATEFPEDQKEYLANNFAVVDVDTDGYVSNMIEKPGKSGQEPSSNIGAYASYIYTKDTVKLIKSYLESGRNPDAPGNFPVFLHKIKPVSVYKFGGKDKPYEVCYDIGTLPVYYDLNKKFTNSNLHGGPCQ